MPENPLTDRVQQLIQDKISTVLQLEILLHLYQTRPRFVPLTEMVRPLAIDPAPLNEQLSDLQRRGLLVGQTTPEVAFAYLTTDPDQDEAVRELAEAYQTYRVSVINLIYPPKSDKIRTFANAFRLRKDEKEPPQ